jgi:hypothetical protein
MVAGQAECRIPGLDIEGDTANAWQKKWIAFVVHFPSGPGTGHAGFAGQKHFNHFIFVCF